MSASKLGLLMKSIFGACFFNLIRKTFVGSTVWYNTSGITMQTWLTLDTAACTGIDLQWPVIHYYR